MNRRRFPSCRALLAAGVAVLMLGAASCAGAQQGESPEQQVERLSAAVDRAQAQVQASEQELLELKRSLADLEARLGKTPASGATAPSAAEAAAEQRERQAIEESQITTLNQSKVESRSRYPVSISGLILLNGFVNTSGVDIPLAPAVAIAGDGTTGASLRQTSLAVDARGPTLAGANSHADAEVDFLGNAADAVNATVAGLVRLRTAHATLDWSHTQAYFQFDRPILNPNTPTSLAAIAEPALAWSGNLWQWVPQAGVSQTVPFAGSRRLEIGAALIDVPDPPVLTTSVSSIASQGERSRWPGSELRLGVAGGGKLASFGVGGYFSPHKIENSRSYNAWAGTLDWRLPLPAGFSLTGSAYRGAALGGLGDGTYKDVVARQVGGALDWRPLDDVGGWTQLKKQAGQRLEFNAALGLDEAFAKELRSFPVNDSLLYANLARNRTFTGNAIWSPSAYLVFSFEYRRISSFSLGAPAAASDVIGLAAGYKF